MGNYVVINNIEVDLRNLEKMDQSNVFYPLIKDSHGINRSHYDAFIENLNEIKCMVDKRNLPYTDIVAIGKPGIIIDSDIHLKTLEDELRYNSKHFYSDYLLSWYTYHTVNSLKNISIDDTLFNYVPLNLSLTPYFKLDDDKMVSTYEALHMKPITSDFSTIVELSSFIKELNRYDNEGLKFMLDDVEIKTYEDYFTKFLNMDYDRDGKTRNRIMIDIPKERIRG